MNELNDELWRAKYQETLMTTSGGLTAAKRNDKWGFVNHNGKEICPFKYDSVLPFLMGTATVSIANQWGVIDDNGKEIVPVYYDKAFYFSYELAQVIKNGKTGFVNKRGEVAIR